HTRFSRDWSSDVCSSDLGKAMDYALLRASEVALENDFDWFSVTNRETIVDRERIPDYTEVGIGADYETVQSCGLLTCRTVRRPEIGRASCRERAESEGGG